MCDTTRVTMSGFQEDLDVDQEKKKVKVSQKKWWERRTEEQMREKLLKVIHGNK